VADDGIIVEAGKAAKSELYLNAGRKVPGKVIDAEGKPLAKLTVSCNSPAAPQSGGPQSGHAHHCSRLHGSLDGQGSKEFFHRLIFTGSVECGSSRTVPSPSCRKISPRLMATTTRPPHFLKTTKAKGVPPSATPPYTSRIIKAGALLDDTKTLLSHWDTTASVPENLDRIRRENVFVPAEFGKWPCFHAAILLIRDSWAMASVVRGTCQACFSFGPERRLVARFAAPVLVIPKRATIALSRSATQGGLFPLLKDTAISQRWRSSSAARSMALAPSAIGHTMG
jgi:hypothetical protein